MGDSFASYLLGLPATFLQMAADNQRIGMGLYQFWVQDDWKVLPRLTLNVGLRWEPYLPPVDHQGPLPGFLPGVHSKVAPGAPTGLIFSGDIRDTIYPADWNNFAPRAGFAWDVTGRSNTVIRGGYGIYYRQPPLNIQRTVGHHGGLPRADREHQRAEIFRRSIPGSEGRRSVSVHHSDARSTANFQIRHHPR